MRLALALTAATLVASPAQAQREPSYLATISGTCSQLTISDEDRSAACPGTLFNMVYVDNTSSFRIIAEDGVVISFFGNDNAAVGDTATLDVTALYYTPAITEREGESFESMVERAKAATQELPATGQCIYTNPELPDNYIRCTAKADGKAFSFRFSATDFTVTDLGGRIQE